MHRIAIFINFNKACFFVFSSKFKFVSIDRKDSDDVPSIPRALMERLTNLTVEYDLWRLAMRGWYCAALRSLFIIKHQDKAWAKRAPVIKDGDGKIWRSANNELCNTDERVLVICSKTEL